MKQWPLHKAYFWETAPFFRILLPFVSGIAIYDAGWIGGVDIRICLCLLAASAAIYLFSIWRKWRTAATFISIQLSLLLAAFAICYYHDAKRDANWFGNHLHDTEAFTGVLLKQPAEKERTYKLELNIIGSITDTFAQRVNGKAFVYVYKDKAPLSLQAGDTIIIPNKWQFIKNAGNPFEFDYALHCARNNIFYQQFLDPSDAVRYNTAPAEISLTMRLHHYCMDVLKTHIHDSATLGIIQAMLVGDEANFDPELRQAYAETGIIHIIAISGSHITVFFFLISFLLGWIKHKKYRWLKYLAALPLIWFYVMMAGAPPSAVRAAAMFSLLGIGLAFNKGGNSLNHLFATAFILLCAQPMWLFAVGFQLSFIAVLGLILFYRPVYKIYMPGNRLTKGLWGTVSASLAAELLVAPLVIYYFHIFPVAFLVANVAAYCFMGIVLVLGISIILLHFLPVAAGAVATITVWLTSLFNEIVFVLQKVNPDASRYLQLSAVEMILVYLSISAFAVFLLKRAGHSLFIGLAALCLLLMSFCRNEWIALHQERLVVYNTGKHSYIEWIKGKSHSVIYRDSTMSRKKIGYAVKPAHTGWRAYKKIQYTGTEVLVIGKKTVLILREPAQVAVTFPIQYIVVNYPVKPEEIAGLQQTYQPAQIIISAHIPFSKTGIYKAAAGKCHANLHITATDGAAIIEPL